MAIIIFVFCFNRMCKRVAHRDANYREPEVSEQILRQESEVREAERLSLAQVRAARQEFAAWFAATQQDANARLAAYYERQN